MVKTKHYLNSKIEMISKLSNIRATLEQHIHTMNTIMAVITFNC